MIRFRFVVACSFLTLITGIWLGRLATEMAIGSSLLAGGAGPRRGTS